MIVARRSTVARYSTDSTAHDVSRFLAAPARLESRPQAAPSTSAPLDLARLYPAMFAAAQKPSLAVRTLRIASGALPGFAAAVVATAASLRY